MSRKLALIIGNTEYADPGLAQLTAPGKDAEDFARVLKDQNVCAFDDVNILLNQPEHIIRRAIDDFFDQKKPDDLLLFYFSGHGVRDELGSLYFAVKNTIRTRLRSTAIKSDYVREAMDHSRSKRQVLILDCCNSGAFPQGTKAETGGTMGMTRALQGYGRFILTASDSTQFAWEGNKVIGETDNSLFTHFLVKGLEGEADRESDGLITVDELYDYAYEEICKLTPHQTPTKSASKQEGEIVLREITRIEDIRPVTLPEQLISEIENQYPEVRLRAVQQLEKLLRGKHLGLARSAQEALKRLEKEDDSRRVSQAASQALQSSPVTEKSAPQKIEAEHVAAKEGEAGIPSANAIEGKGTETEETGQPLPSRIGQGPSPHEKPEPQRQASSSVGNSLPITAGSSTAVRQLPGREAPKPVEHQKKENIFLRMYRAWIGLVPWKRTLILVSGMMLTCVAVFGYLSYSFTSGLVDRVKQMFRPASPAQLILPGDTALPVSLDTKPSNISEVAFSPDGSLLASAGTDGIKLWKVGGDSSPDTISQSKSKVIAFSPDGAFLASSSSRDITIWNVSDGTVKRKEPGDTPIVELVFSSDGNILASAGWDNIVRLWRIHDGGIERQVHVSDADHIALSPEGNLLASGGFTKIEIWDTRDGTLITTLLGHASVTSVAFSSDGKTLASSSADGTIVLWEFKEGKRLLTTGKPTGSVQSISFSADGQWLASASVDKTVRLWNVEDGKLLRTLEGHTGSVNSVSFSPDGRLLASGSSDGTIRIWEITP